MSSSKIKRVLIIGAGRMSPPVVDYFVQYTDYKITIADANLDQARTRAGRYSEERTNSIQAQVGSDSETDLGNTIQNADIVISLIPPAFDSRLTEICIQRRTPLVTASYVNDEMRSLDGDAKAAGVVVLGEAGLDPGLDHMAALRVIHRAQDKGQQITGLVSYCGGLPYNMIQSNPLQYKISWSPEVLMSVIAKRATRFKQQGEIVMLPPEQVFAQSQIRRFEGFMNLEFDTYPNGNAERYLTVYGIESAQTCIRATLRYRGWNEIFHALHQLGWFTDKPAHDVVQNSRTVAADSRVMEVLDWLGLMKETAPRLTAFQYIQAQFTSKLELRYEPGERDLVLLQNVVDIEGSALADKTIRVTSTLQMIGEENGLSAMAKSVGLTCAIAARLISEKQYTRPGVQIPIAPELYKPLLDEIAGLGIIFEETHETFDKLDN